MEPMLVITNSGAGTADDESLDAALEVLRSEGEVEVAATSSLDELDEVLTMLNNKDQQLKETVAAAGPYAEILGNIIGTGPWFDTYIQNIPPLPAEGALG